MDEARLRELAADLADEAAAGNDAAAEVLVHLERYLDEPAVEEHHQALHERLSEGVRHFEVTHPELSATLQAVVNSLTASGI